MRNGEAPGIAKASAASLQGCLARSGLRELKAQGMRPVQVEVAKAGTIGRLLLAARARFV
jgi:hypothetical protein